MRLVGAQAKESSTPVYAATFGSVEQTGRRWGHCARQAGWGLNSRIHAVADGALWICRQSREVFGAQGHFVNAHQDLTHFGSRKIDPGAGG